MGRKNKVLEPGERRILQIVTHVLVSHFAPTAIIHYSTTVHQHKIRSLFCNQKPLKERTIYLLLIDDSSTAMDDGIVERMQDEANNLFDKVHVVIHAHTDEDVKFKLQERNPYFVQVINEGKVLFSAPSQSPWGKWEVVRSKEYLAKAVSVWRKQNDLGKGFIDAAEQAIASDQDRVGLCALYHACTRFCSGLIWVFMAYDHPPCKLDKLLRTCGCFSHLPVQHFFGTHDNEQLLNVMINNFNSRDFEQLKTFGELSTYRFLDLVKSFANIADGLCKQQFVELESELQQQGALQKEVSHG
ncbi:hypothetical protein [Pedobacter frigidisoli]|uniref:hypothetical protein n=1 Tax=Pedobacter frigidisoli TaxID=2530455 RepID=UPI00292F90B0|nr:hypothetical protein [Pedobacter frigidisoli]